MVIELSTVLWILGASGVVIGGLLGAGYKENQRRLNKQDAALAANQTMLTSILSEVSAIKAGKVGFVTMETCVLNNKAFELKYDAKILEAKNEVLEEVEAVEVRLTKRIEKLEDKKVA